MKRDSGRVEKILEKFEWEEIELPEDINGLGSNARSEIAEKLKDLKARQDEVNNLSSRRRNILMICGPT